MPSSAVQTVHAEPQGTHSLKLQNFEVLLTGVPCAQVVEGDNGDGDEDEIMVVSQDVNMKDPFTTLDLKEENGKWPLALPCRHVYNYSTVMDKNPRTGKWNLDKCASKCACCS